MLWIALSEKNGDIIERYKILETNGGLSLVDVIMLLCSSLTPPTEALISGRAFRMRWGNNKKWEWE